MKTIEAVIIALFASVAVFAIAVYVALAMAFESMAEFMRD